MSELKLKQSRLDGRYDILECLGRGSYAEIYAAKDIAASNGATSKVVIKALNISLREVPDVELEATLVTNFQNEAVALDLVRHPKIINRLGHGTAIDLAGALFHYIVLEYLPGGDMAAVARAGPLPIEKALFYLEQVCSGLAHAHQCGVIHRDIKPQNLLLTADQQVVKIADFGVARMVGIEGAITRVGTNIYSAPEHNPIIHTGEFDIARMSNISDLLTPAADVYSLAKTTYTLLAGDSPRRFAQHAITDLPPSINGKYWSERVLQVLRKATQTRPEDRYQSVGQFWDDFAEATLPPTEPLVRPESSLRHKSSADLLLDVKEMTQAPPEARFDVIATSSSGSPGKSMLATATTESQRPRIVVPVHKNLAPPQALGANRTNLPDSNGTRNGRKPVSSVFHASSRTKRAVVALLLVLAFSGMLLATHRYVTSHWNPLIIPQVSEVGREGLTTTDVNLRSAPAASSNAIGLAELGSRVKVLSIDSNWYEVQIVAHGRTKADVFSSDHGWINKKFVRFD